MGRSSTALRFHSSDEVRTWLRQLIDGFQEVNELHHQDVFQRCQKSGVVELSKVNVCASIRFIAPVLAEQSGQ